MNEMYVTRDEEEGIRSSNELPRDPVFLSPSTVEMHQNRGIFPSLAIPAVRPSSHARARFKRHAHTQYLNITAPEISISIAHRAEPLEGYTKPSRQRSSKRNAPIFI